MCETAVGGFVGISTRYVQVGLRYFELPQKKKKKRSFGDDGMVLELLLEVP